MFCFVDTITRSDCLSRGRVMTRHMVDDPGQTYFLYLPHSWKEGCPIFVTVHGVRRMAWEHAARFAPLAERYGIVLVAPLFPKERFGDYQRLGLSGQGPRADLALNRIIDEVTFLTGADSDQLYLFGYSGGGQFVHRYAMVHPHRPKRIVVAAPGWYTFPDHRHNFPFGVKKVPGWSGISIDLNRFLSIPTCVLVGAKDTRRDGELNRSSRIDRQQGHDRLQRARTWIRAMEKAARFRRLTTEFDFQILPGCRHSFVQCMRKGGMGTQIFSFLFDAATDYSEEKLQS